MVLAAEGENTRVWVSVPEGQTVSCCPQYLAEGQQFAVPNWLPEVLAFRDSHPDVTIVWTGEYPMQLAGGQWVESEFYEAFPPPAGCDPATWLAQPNAVELRCRFTGEMTTASFPAEVQHYLYRVPYPATWHTLWSN